MTTTSIAGKHRLFKRSFGLALALLIAVGGAAWLAAWRQPQAHAAQTEAYFVINVPPRNDEFVIKLVEPLKIEHARALLNRTRGGPAQVQGKIIKQSASYNPPWSFHFDPLTIQFFDSAVEVCDGSIAYVETHLDEAGGAFLPGNLWCPWSSRLVREIPPPPVNTQLASVSAASYRRVGLSGDAIIAAYGAQLALTTETATETPLPTVLAGTTVRVTDSQGVERFAPLFFVSPLQVNYLMPPGTAPGYATVVITNGNGVQKTERTQVLDYAPGLFAANANGHDAPLGLSLRLGEDGSVQLNPLARFDEAQNKYVPAEIDLGADGDQVFLVLFGTGMRRTGDSPPLAKIGNEVAEILYLGAQPDFIGLDQVNLRVPRELAGQGEVKVTLLVDDQKANAMTLKFK